MNRIYWLVIGVVLLTACVGELSQDAAGNVATTFGATKAWIGFEKGIDTEEGSINQLLLTLENPSNLPDSFSLDEAGSIASKLLLDQLEPADWEGSDEIKIIIEKNDSTSEITFKISDILSANKQIATVLQYLNLATRLSIDSLSLLIDFGMMSKEIFDKYNIDLVQIDSVFGGRIQNTITGFRFDETEDDVPVLVVWAETIYRDGSMFKYTFYVRRGNSKILYVMYERVA